MTICERLKDIIQDDAHLSLVASTSNKSVSLTIEETDRSAKFKQVKLNDVSAHATFAWKLDCNKKHKLSPYFKDGKGLDKGCDAVIVTEIKSQWYIFIVELKSNPNREKADVVKQFKSSLCFVKYIQAILRIIYKDHDISKVKPCCVLFSKGASNARSTKNNSKRPVKKGEISIKHLRNKECSIQRLTR